jgi:DNA invertase Pin-like site-specific DNA recombinase
VLDVIIDDGVSASRHARRKRIGWPAVLERIAAGQVGALVTWETSRATRALGDYAALRDLLRSTGTVWLAGGSVVDLGLSGAVRAVVDEDEAERARERVLRAVRANAEQGRPHGRRLYGYRRLYDPATGAPAGQEIEPTEAAVVLEAARRFLAGESLRAVATDLNRRKVTSPGGTEWSNRQLRRTLANPGYAARRVHQGRVVGRAAWPPILDDETFGRLQARFDEPGRRTTREHPLVRLLAGVARCGLCGGPMVRGKSRGGRPVYTCKASQHLVRDLVALDAYVTEVVLARLTRPDALALAAETESEHADATAARAEAADLRARLDSAVSEFTAGRLTAMTLAKIETDLLACIEAAERRARVVGLPTVAADLVGADDVRGAWESMTVEQRRALIRALMVPVVLPAGRGRRFDPEAVRIDWRR